MYFAMVSQKKTEIDHSISTQCSHGQKLLERLLKRGNEFKGFILSLYTQLFVPPRIPDLIYNHILIVNITIMLFFLVKSNYKV